MIRTTETLVFALGFLFVVIGVAFRVYADLIAGVDHATLANQDILRELLPSDATSVSVLAFDRSVPPFPGQQTFAIHQVFFRTGTSNGALRTGWTERLVSRGWAQRLRFPGGPPDPASETWCRGPIQVSFGGDSWIALTSIGSDRGSCQAPAVIENLSDSTVDGIVGALPFVAYLAIAQRARHRGRRARGGTTASMTGIAQHAVAFAWVPYAVLLTRPLPEVAPVEALRLAGLVLAVGGVTFALWAMRTLGRHFDLELEVHADHEVVRRGPYALVRHPIYAGLIVHTIGLCLATGNVLLAAGSLFGTVPILVLRARAEEALLREQLGAAYDEYAKRVGMLVPFR